jgi:hypothetical protein
LTLSDVVLADRVERRTETPAGRSDFLIDPNPPMRFAPGDAVHLYWEIYNLQPDTTGSIRYTAEVVLRVQSVERTGLVARAVGPVLDAAGLSAKGDDPVSLRYDVTEALAGRNRVPAWVAVDLLQAPAGTYTLELGITDQISKQTATRRPYSPSPIGSHEADHHAGSRAGGRRGARFRPRRRTVAPQVAGGGHRGGGGRQPGPDLRPEP